MKGVIVKGAQLIIGATPSVFDLNGTATPKDYHVRSHKDANHRFYDLSRKVTSMTSDQLRGSIVTFCDQYERSTPRKIR